MKSSWEDILVGERNWVLYREKRKMPIPCDGTAGENLWKTEIS